VTDPKKSHDGRETRVLEYVYAHPGLSQMRGSPAQVLAAIDEFAAEQDFLINVGEDKGGIVAGLIAREKPKVFVELGGYVGYSAILFGDAMRKAGGGGGDLRYWSLEFNPVFAAVAMALVDLAGLGDVVKVVVGPADESLRRLHAEGQLQTVDVLFLDHVEDLYESDLKVCESLGLLKPGALVVADNVVRPGAPEYRKYVRSHPGLDSHGVRGLIMPGAFEVRRHFCRLFISFPQSFSHVGHPKPNSKCVCVQDELEVSRVKEM
jgi:catechol O-methyltransferase